MKISKMVLILKEVTNKKFKLIKVYKNNMMK